MNAPADLLAVARVKIRALPYVSQITLARLLIDGCITPALAIIAADDAEILEAIEADFSPRRERPPGLAPLPEIRAPFGRWPSFGGIKVTPV